MKLELFRHIAENYDLDIEAIDKLHGGAKAEKISRDLVEYLESFVEDIYARDEGLSDDLFRDIVNDKVAQDVMKRVFSGLEVVSTIADIERRGIDIDKPEGNAKGIESLGKVFGVFASICVAVACEVVLEMRRQQEEENK